GWTFVIWGLLHGVGLVVCRAWDQAKLPMPAWLGWGLTVVFVVLAFMIFRAPDVATVWNMSAGLLGSMGTGRTPDKGVLALLLILGFLAVVRLPNPDLVFRYLRPQPAGAVGTAAAAVYVMLEVGRGAPSSFIYFQF